jgi:endonuclease III
MGGQWALEQTSSGTREKVQGLLGKNLASLAPVTSVTGLVNPPPAAKLAQSAVSAVDELIRERGLSGKKAAELRKAATPFVPFSGVYKKAMP